MDEFYAFLQNSQAQDEEKLKMRSLPLDIYGINNYNSIVPILIQN